MTERDMENEKNLESIFDDLVSRVLTNTKKNLIIISHNFIKLYFVPT